MTHSSPSETVLSLRACQALSTSGQLTSQHLSGPSSISAHKPLRLSPYPTQQKPLATKSQRVTSPPTTHLFSVASGNRAFGPAYLTNATLPSHPFWNTTPQNYLLAATEHGTLVHTLFTLFLWFRTQGTLILCIPQISLWVVFLL